MTRLCPRCDLIDVFYASFRQPLKAGPLDTVLDSEWAFVGCALVVWANDVVFSFSINATYLSSLSYLNQGFFGRKDFLFIVTLD